MANINQMIADLDSQISSLQTARQALAEAHGVGSALNTVGPRRTSYAKVSGDRPRRTMSPEAREKIRAAQKLRWAKVAKGNKAVAKATSASKVAAPKKAQRPRAKKVASAPVVSVPETVAAE